VAAVDDGMGRTSTFDCGPTKQENGQPQPAAHVTPTAGATPLVRRCCEFRLGGSQEQTQTVALDPAPAGKVIVAIERLRAYLAGDGTAGAPASPIGGIEVHAHWCAGQVACTARLSDFRTDDLVVVQVDLAVYAAGGAA
jgi:hypothetical protein